LRLEDALAATRAAIDEGIVPGGGVALLNAEDILDLNNVSDEDLRGYWAVKTALRQPFENIVENAGLKGDETRATLATKIYDIKNCGYDVMSGQFVDMIENGIIDPAKVTRTALQNALSVATMIISTKVLISEDKETKE
jgi:chaperonin GroEL